MAKLLENVRVSLQQCLSAINVLGLRAKLKVLLVIGDHSELNLFDLTLNDFDLTLKLLYSALNNQALTVNLRLLAANLQPLALNGFSVGLNPRDSPAIL